MTNTTVHFLASYYNMTIHNFKKRNYLLEVNPKYTDDSYEDYLNVIDARWIDTETGLFIDITAVRPKPGVKNVLCSKDQHEEWVSVAECWTLSCTNVLISFSSRHKTCSRYVTVYSRARM